MIEGRITLQDVLDARHLVSLSRAKWAAMGEDDPNRDYVADDIQRYRQEWNRLRARYITQSQEIARAMGQ